MRRLSDALLSTLADNFIKGEVNERDILTLCSVFYITEDRQIFYQKDRILDEKTDFVITASCFVRDNKIILFSVRRSYRRMGYGENLLSFVLSKYNNLELFVRESNIPALSLYKKLGFKETRTVENFYSYTRKNETGIEMKFETEKISCESEAKSLL